MFPCLRNIWGQLLSVGDGRSAPMDALFINVPKERQQYMEKLGKESHSSMCLGAAPTVLQSNNHDDTANKQPNNDTETLDGDMTNVVTIPCTNNSQSGAVVLEFFFVPFIVAEESLPASTMKNEKEEQTISKVSTTPMVDIAFLPTGEDLARCAYN